VQWSNVGDFTAGKGWQPGSNKCGFIDCCRLLLLTVCRRPITFSGSYNPGSSGGSLAVYGWSKSPLVEYYIMEDFPSPPTYGLTQVGTLTSDGSSYTFYKHQQVNQPSIVSSSSTFEQYISIRSSPRTSGTVTVANHFNAWAAAGLTLGSLDYQIVSTESYGGGSGSASITVSQGSSSGSTTTVPTSSSSSVSTAPTTSAGGGGAGCSGSSLSSSSSMFVCSPTPPAIYGQCGGLGWSVGRFFLSVHAHCLRQNYRARPAALLALAPSATLTTASASDCARCSSVLAVLWGCRIFVFAWKIHSLLAHSQNRKKARA
jgi:endo-1,4-beta-xylanase